MSAKSATHSGQFKPGTPKPANSGRKRGTGNKSRIPRIEETLAKQNIDPAQEILNILQETKVTDSGETVLALSPSQRVSAWLELLSYCQAKPKAFEEPPADDFDPEDFKEVDTASLLELVKKSS